MDFDRNPTNSDENQPQRSFPSVPLVHRLGMVPAHHGGIRLAPKRQVSTPSRKYSVLTYLCTKYFRILYSPISGSETWRHRLACYGECEGQEQLLVIPAELKHNITDP